MADNVRNGVLVMDERELAYLQNYIDAGDRGGFYLGYYNMTGSEQAFEQAQVMSFSENKGGIAYSVNALVQSSFPSAYEGIYYMSQNVAKGAMDTIAKSARDQANGGAARTGYLTDGEFFTTTLYGWYPTGVEKFPGNAVIGPIPWPLVGGFVPGQFVARSYDPQIFNQVPLPEFSQTARVYSSILFESILKGPYGDLLNPLRPPLNPTGKNTFLEMYQANPAYINSIFSAFPQNVGQIAGSSLAVFDAQLLGKRPEDYVGRSGYSQFVTPDGKVQSAVVDSSGKQEAMFDLAGGSSMDRQLGRAAALFSTWAKFIWGLSGATKEFRLSLTEKNPGFNGDVNPNRTNSFSVSSPTWKLAAAATGGNDTIWANPAGGTTSGGGGDDFVFGGTKRDVLNGDSGNDVLYGRSGNDELHGGAGEDLLRGGDGGDTLYGEGGDDVLDGGDIAPGTFSKDTVDRLFGGEGDDILFGGFGGDRLFGEAGDDTLIGGTGNDELDGGEGDDTYETFTHDGHDIISDSDGEGSIYYNDEQLTVAERVATRGSQQKWKSADGRFIYQVTAGDIRTGATIEVSGDGFASGDGFSLIDVKIENDGDSFLGLEFDTKQKVALRAGQTGNFFESSGSGSGGQEDPPDTQTTLGERLVKFFTVSLRQFLRPNERVIIRGGGTQTIGVRGSDEVAFENGELELNATEGQTEVTFGIYEDEDLDEEQALQLTAVVVDENGEEVTSNTVTVNLDGEEETDDPETSEDIFGDRAYLMVPDGNGGETFNYDQWGNPVTTDEVIPNLYDFRYDTPGNDHIDTGGAAEFRYWDFGTSDYVDAQRGGDDLIEQTGAGRIWADAGDGDDVLIGGTGADDEGLSQDMLTGGAGDDVLYAEEQVEIEDAVEAGRTDEASDNPWEGDFLSGNSGDDILISGADRDFLSGGGGEDVLISGAGDDVILGDSDYSAADIIELGYWGWGYAGMYWKIDGDFENPELSVFNVNPGGEGDPADSDSDLIYAGNGDDLVFAGGEDDTVWGDAGDDRLFGEGGADALFGGDGDDILAGDSGDTPISDQGADFLDGGEGDDVLFGAGEGDVLYGGAGDDEIYGDDLENSGDDYIDGEDGDDLLVGAGGSDTIYGGEGDDSIGGDASNIDSTLHGDDYIDGGDGDDEVAGGGGSDTIFGGDGDDHLEGDGDESDESVQGDDYIDAGAGEDTVIGGGGADTIFGGEGDDQLFGEGANDPEGTAGDDFIDGEEGDDIIVGGAGGDTLFGGEGDDQVFGESSDPDEEQGDDFLDGGEGDDELNGGGGNDELYGGEGDDTLYGDAANTPDDAMGDDYIDGGEGNDIIAGAGGDDTIFGGEGNDQIDGDGDNIDPSLHGSDYIDGGEGDDVIFGGDKNDTIVGGEGDDALIGDEGDDVLEGGDGVDFLDGSEGNDTLSGGEGADVYDYDFVDGGEDHISDSGSNTLFLHGVNPLFLELRLGSLVLSAGNPANVVHLDNFDPDNIAAGAGIDTFVFDNGEVLSFAQLLQRGITFDVTPDQDFVVGTSLNDTIDALGGDDMVGGGAGNDTLRGNQGSDILIGELGDDLLDGGGDSDVLIGAEGADQLFGGEGDDILDGGDGNDRLHGDAGADTLTGGLGDDIYFIDDESDTLVENADEGTDTVTATFSYTLADNFENLTLSGDAPDLVGTGNDVANVIRAGSEAATLYGMGGDDKLIGSVFNDVLDGGEGVDEMAGGAGDDLYVVDSADDRVIEQDARFRDIHTGEVTVFSAGYDSVESSISLNLSKFVENLALTGSDAIDGGGNSEQNYLYGNDAANVLTSTVLDGKNDNLVSGPGTVTYIDFPGQFPNGSDERLWDRALRRYFEGEVTSDDLESIGVQIFVDARGGDVLVGNGGNDRLLGGWDHDELYGGEGDDFLVGSGGADYLEGGAGDDAYVVDSGFSYAFGYSNSASIWYQDDHSDDLFEYEDEGTDLVYSNVEEFYLGDNFENLVLMDFRTREELGLDAQDGLMSESFFAARIGGGNDLDNVITGNFFDNDLYGEGGADTIYGMEGWDYIDGGAGADQMYGGDGSDYYVVDDAGDLVVEEAFPDVDSVESSLTYTLTANVENLYLTGETFEEDLDGTGNELDNEIVGNDGVNVLLGLAGNDTISGRDGNDTLLGGEGDDSLDGGFDDDVMTGGAGNDTYFVDSDYDTTFEAFDEGIDNVLSWRDHELGANIENLYLQDYDDLFGLGNELDNEIIGNFGWNYLEGFEGNDHIAGGEGQDEIYGDEGNDFLEGGGWNDYIEGNEGDDVIDGGFGADYMVGGTGDDTYYVDYSYWWDPFNRDRTIEELDEGYDQVFESVDSYRLEENVEKGTVIGEFADDPGYAELYGNDLDNTLVGNDGDFNFIQDDQGGDDTVDGRAGRDVVYGGTGDDTLYGGDDALRLETHWVRLDKDEGLVVIEDEEPGAREAELEILAENDDSIYGEQGDDAIDGGSGDDDLYGGEGDDTIYGGDDGLTGDSFVIDSAEGSEGGDETPIGERVFLTNADYISGGEGDDWIDGGSDNDQIYGDEGDDFLFGGEDGPLNESNDDDLYGGDGQDHLEGGSGDDYLDGGDGILDEGIDFMAGGTGSDTYIVTGYSVLTDEQAYDDCGDPIEGEFMLQWTTDTVVEGDDDGYDYVYSYADFVMPENVEYLQLQWFSDARNAYGSEGDNTIFGNNYDNRLEGRGGSDTLIGDEGDDILDGGAGDDLLFGGEGNDTYNLRLGGGQDYVFTGGGTDTILVLSYLTLDDLTLSRLGSSLVLTMDDTHDRMIVSDWFDNRGVEYLEFCSGGILDGDQIEDLASARYIDSGDDYGLVQEDGVQVATGNVLDNDTDSLGLDFVLTSAGTMQSQYGTLELAADGSYTYVLNNDAVQWLAEGRFFTDTFGYSTENSEGTLGAGTLYIDIEGQNDAPVILDTTDGSVTEDTGRVVYDDVGGSVLPNGGFEEGGFDYWDLSGNLDFTSVERWFEIPVEEGDYAAQFGAIGSPTFLSQDVETEAGMHYQLRFLLRGDDDGESDGVATFSASWDGAILTSLDHTPNEWYDEFTYEVVATSDFSHLEFAFQNDPDYWQLDGVELRPVFDSHVEAYGSQGTEGTLHFQDVDFEDEYAHELSFTPQGSDYLGDFNAGIDIGSDDGSTGTIDWFFEVPNWQLQYLAEGETLTQSYDVTVSDSHGVTDTETVTVQIHGVNDAPEILDATTEASIQEDAGTIEYGSSLLANGSFESGDLSGWTQGGDSGASYVDSGYSSDGDFEAVIATAGSPAVLGQDVDTVAGQFYELSFDLAGFSGNGYVDFNLSWNGSIIDSFFIGSASDYTSWTFGLEGIDGTSHLELSFMDDSGTWFLDAFELRPVTYLPVPDVHTTDGTLDFVDVDFSDAHIVSVQPQDSGYRGTFSTFLDTDSTGDQVGTARWTFEVANADLQDLRINEQLTQYYDVTVDDGHGGTTTTTVTIYLNGENEAPTTVGDAADVQEDVQLSTFGNVLDNDSDIDRSEDGFLYVANAGTYAGQYGTLYLYDDGSYEYQLDNALDSVQQLHAGESVSDDFEYLASDEFGYVSSGTLSVHVTGTNDAPVAEADFGGVKEDVTLTGSGNVLDNDSDLDHDTVLHVANPGTYVGAYGKLQLAADGSYTYTLKNNQVNWLAEGELLYDTFSYVATDGDALDPLGANATLTIEIEGTNDAPKAAKDANSVFEDGVLRAIGNVLDNDTDVDTGTVLSVTTAGTYAGFFGTLVLNGDGTYTYDLDTTSARVQRLRDGQQVTESFAYTATDGYATSSSRLLITVNGANDAPSALDDFANVVEDLAPIVTGNVLQNDTDADGGTLLKVTAPNTYIGAHGTLVLTEQGGYTYTLDNDAAQSLAAGDTVTDVFSYTATDGFEESSAELTVTITGTNDAPTAIADSADVSEDGLLVVTGNVLDNDGDVDAGASVSAVIPGTYTTAYGTLVLESDGDYTYTLDNGSSAVQSLHGHDIVLDTFEYSADDGEVQTGSTLTIRIEGRNDTPLGANDGALVREDDILSASGNLLANDTDADAGTSLTVTNAGTFAGAYGTLIVDANGDYSFALDNAAAQSLGQGETAHQYFIYTMSDGYIAPYPELPSDRGFALLDITIEGVNDAPVAVADFAAVVEDGPLSAEGNVLLNDTDADASAIITLATAPGDYTGLYGTLTLAGDGHYDYLLNDLGAQHLAAGESVYDTFTYSASDGIEQSTGTLTVRISGANDAPTTVADAASVTEDTVVTAIGNVLGNDSDVDAGTTLTVANFGTLTGTFGTLSLASNGNYTYSLNNGSTAVQSLGVGQTRTDVFTYQARDGLAQTPGTLTVTINGTNDAPVVVADSAAVSEDGVTSVSASVLTNDSDIDAGTTLSVLNFGTYAGTYGSLALNQNGSYTYTLNNASTAVQSLRQGQAVSDVFSYTATDGLAPRSSTLTVNVTGRNDAPVVTNPIADQNAAAGSSFTFTVAANAFTDIDQGDVLSYSARLADGSALPSWLTFNAATRTFTGTPPGTSGGSGDDCGCGDGGEGTPAVSYQVRVTATDQLAASAFDDFTLNVSGTTGGGDGHSGQLIVGTKGNDVLTGTACDDVIDGREGYDKMTGGAGNDVYFVDQTSTYDGHGHDHDINSVVDLVTEKANEGYDTVYANTDYVLTSNVEELRLLECDDFSGTGNALDNVIVGNPGKNTLNGGAGNDTLEGGEGNDTLTGGSGADTYVYTLHDGNDTIDEKGSSSQTDTLKLQGMNASSVRVNKSGNDLLIDFPGRDGKVTIKNWFSSSASRVEQFKFDDGTVWDEAKIRSRVGKSVSPVYDSGSGSSSSSSGYGGGSSGGGHDDDHHGGNGGHDGHDDDHHGDDDDCHERDCRNDSDEDILKRLKKPAKFCFEDIMQAMGHTGPTMSAAEIARRWATVRGYFCEDGNCDDHHGGAEAFPSLKDLGLTVASHGGDCSGGYGYGGSTGGQHGGDPWFQCFNGLSDGFKKL